MIVQIRPCRSNSISSPILWLTINFEEDYIQFSIVRWILSMTFENYLTNYDSNIINIASCFYGSKVRV